MEVVVAVITGASLVIAALVTRRKVREVQDQVATNGSKKTLGQLVELMYEDVQYLKSRLEEHIVHPNPHQGVRRWKEE